jgi:hypothetical protein
MNIQNTLSGAANITPLRGAFLRELAPRQDRVAPDQRIDSREIQESFRVSFSNAVRADATGATRDAAQTPVELASPGIRAYQQIAAL